MIQVNIKLPSFASKSPVVYVETNLKEFDYAAHYSKYLDVIGDNNHLYVY